MVDEKSIIQAREGEKKRGKTMTSESMLSTIKRLTGDTTFSLSHSRVGRMSKSIALLLFTLLNEMKIEILSRE